MHIKGWLIGFIVLVGCSSPVITQTGNMGNNTSHSIVGSTGSTIEATSHEKTNNTGNAPSVNLNCLPSFDFNSPLGNLSSLGNLAPCPASPSPLPSPTSSPCTDALQCVSPSPSASPTPTPTPIPTPHILVYVVNHPGVWSLHEYDTDLPEILEQAGYQVTVTDRITSGFISSDMLAPYDQFWILPIRDNGQQNLTLDERIAIDAFRDTPHGIAVITDHFNLTDATFITQPWGITFLVATHRDPGFPIIKPSPEHPILNTVNSLSAFNNGATFTLTGAARPVGIAGSTHQAFAGSVEEAHKGRVFVDGDFARFADIAGTGLGSGHENSCPECLIRYGDGEQYIENIANWLQRRL